MLKLESQSQRMGRSQGGQEQPDEEAATDNHCHWIFATSTFLMSLLLRVISQFLVHLCDWCF